MGKTYIEKTHSRILGLIVVLALLTPTTQANLYQWSGFSAKGIAVSYEATFTISGDLLTVQLSNTSSVTSAWPWATNAAASVDLPRLACPTNGTA